MVELLKIEYLKVKHYTVVRAFLLLFVILLPLLFYGMGMIEFPLYPSKGELFGFSSVWKYLTYIASFFNVFPAILIIVLVCNEVTFKTQKQNVIDGLSRKQVILSKFYVVIALTLVVTFYVFLVGVIFGAIYSNISYAFQGIEPLFFFFLQTFGYFSMAFLLAVLLRRTSLGVVAFLVAFSILALISRAMLEEMAQWTPVNVFADLTPFPFLQNELEAMERMETASGVVKPYEMTEWMRAGFAILYAFGFVFLSYFVMKKRDL